MGSIIKMAFRNIFRFKRRTFITFSAISLGLALVVISICLLEGISKQSMASILNSQTSHLTVFAKGYFDKRDDLPIGITIAGPEQVRDRLAALPGVAAAECRIAFAANLIKGMDELPCRGVGFEPDRDPNLFNIRQSLVEGEWPQSGEAKMLIGRSLARDLGLKVGDIATVRLIISDKEEDITWNAVDFTVGGIIDTGNPVVDSGTLFVPFDQARSGLAMSDAATEIVLRLQGNPGDARTLERAKKTVAALLESLPAGLQVYRWDELETVMKIVIEKHREQYNVMILIILFIAAMGIVNTMLMAVLERTREIGMLSAMGMRRREILSLFVLEGGFIGILASIVGCILGGLAGWYMETHGISLTALGGESMAKLTASVYPIKDVFYGELAGWVLPLTFVLGTFFSMLVSFYPALKASRLNPIESLRHI